MFPLSDSIKGSKFPVLTWFLVVMTVFVFIQELIAPNPESFVDHYALIPALVHWDNYRSLTPFLTAVFLHGGFLHILSNMWFLLIFGNNVEDSLPPPVYLLLYVISGIIGNFLQYIIMPDSSIPIIGASGAVAGILGCYYILFPYSKIKTLIFIIVFVTIIEIRAPIMLGIWFILQLFNGYSSLPHMGSAGGVAFFAHVAGFLVGILVGLVYKNRTGIVTKK